MRIWMFFLSLMSCAHFSSAFTIDQEEEFFVKIEDADIFCKRIGTGAPIVVVHGGPGMSHDYLVPALSKLTNTHQVFFYDQRGSGRSTGAINRDTMKVSVFVEDLEFLVKSFGLEKIILVGSSWGGFLATSYAIAHPESIDKLILLSTMPFSLEESLMSEVELQIRLAPYVAEINAIEQSEEFMMREAAVLERYTILRAIPHFHDPDKRNLYSIETPESVFIQKKIQEMLFANEFRYFNLYDQIKDVKFPVLIVHGESDFISISSAEKIHKTIPHSEYIPLKECGHATVLEKLDEVVEALKEFLH